MTTKACHIVYYISVAVCVFHSARSSTVDVTREFEAALRGCAQAHALTPADLAHFQQRTAPETAAAACFLACSYKKTGMMDEEGKLSVEGVHSVSRSAFADDDHKMQKAIEFTEACKSVNDETVGDGSEGCERALLIYKCSIEKAPEFEFGNV